MKDREYIIQVSIYTTDGVFMENELVSEDSHRATKLSSANKDWNQVVQDLVDELPDEVETKEGEF